MTELPRHSVSVTGVVFRDDGQVLAIQRSDDGRWVPPGGVLELNETPSDGVTREVLEETGIKVQAEQLTGVYKNMRLGVVTLAFRCSMIGGNTHPVPAAAGPAVHPRCRVCKSCRAVLLAPGILSPRKDHSQERSLRSRR